MGDRSASPIAGGRYSPQRSYSRSRSRSPGARGRSYTPVRGDGEKVSSALLVCMPRARICCTICLAAPMMHTDSKGHTHGLFSSRVQHGLPAPDSVPGTASKTLMWLQQVSTIYVGGISFDTDERALQNYFEKYGPVSETKVQTAAV